MEEFNIENYENYKNITIAQYTATKKKIEKKAIESARKGDLQTAWHYTKIYFELSRLLDKRVSFGSKNGYRNKRPFK